jgi:iron complex transport system substrate-binding protein
VVFLDESVTEQINMITKLDQAGIPTVVLYDASNSSTIYDNLKIMGKVLHESSTATSMIDMMKNKFNAVATIVGDPEDKPSVMIAVWWSSTTIYVAGSGSFTDEIITDAGGVNAFAYKTSFAQITLEDIVAADPDIIVLTGMAQSNVNYAMDKLNNSTVLSDVHAVVNQDIQVLLGQAENTFLRSGVRMVEGTYLMAMMIYPDKFTEELPNTIGDGYEEYLPSTW